MLRPFLAGCGLALLASAAQAATAAPAAPASTSRYTQDPYPSTYKALGSGPVLLQHASVLTGTGQRLDNADVLLQGGKIVAVGSALDAPADAARVDATGKWVTP
ncbi:hypothetical protein AB4084_02435, partial [Lysobacter sp. 2RAB21]